jgi:hypothetical protein
MNGPLPPDAVLNYYFNKHVNDNLQFLNLQHWQMVWMNNNGYPLKVQFVKKGDLGPVFKVFSANKDLAPFIIYFNDLEGKKPIIEQDSGNLGQL